jgi:hypothetical protein
MIAFKDLAYVCRMARTRVLIVIMIVVCKLSEHARSNQIT